MGRFVTVVIGFKRPSEDTMAVVATKIAELVSIWN